MLIGIMGPVGFESIRYMGSVVLFIDWFMIEMCYVIVTCDAKIDDNNLA
jgi:hypothetical protein